MQSQVTLWAEWILILSVVLFLVFDCGIELRKLAPSVEAATEIGRGEHPAPAIGALLLVSLVFYIILRPSAAGAILPTGYPGRAVASSIEGVNPLSSDLFPSLFAVFACLGINLREPAPRALASRRFPGTELQSAAAETQ